MSVGSGQSPEQSAFGPCRGIRIECMRQSHELAAQITGFVVVVSALGQCRILQFERRFSPRLEQSNDLRSSTESRPPLAAVPALDEQRIDAPLQAVCDLAKQ